jgi:ABC-type lipoprotein release transport system permease subunit
MRSRRLERQRAMIDFTLSSLLRRKGRNIALLLVYATVVFVLASVMFFAHALKREAQLLLKGAPELTVQRTIAGRQGLVPVSYIERIREIRGVTGGRGRLWGYYYYPSVKANFTLMVPEGFGHGPGKLVIGNGVSRVLQVGKGSEMWLQASDGTAMKFIVAATMAEESELVSADLILMSAADFTRLFSIPDGFTTDLLFTVRNPRELPTIAEKITRLFPDSRPIIKDEILRTYDAVFDWRQGIMIAVLSGALLAFAILAWDKASGLSAEERKEIGVLKAIGWETSDVIALKFWEGAVISLASFLVGVIFAYIHVFFFSGAFFEPVLRGWAVLYPKFRPEPFVDAYLLAALFFLVVIPYTVATIVPSWKAAIVDPDAQMR